MLIADVKEKMFQIHMVGGWDLTNAASFHCERQNSLLIVWSVCSNANELKKYFDLLEQN